MNAVSLQSPVKWWTERWLETSGSGASLQPSESGGLPRELGTVGGIDRELGEGLNLYSLAARFRSPVRSAHMTTEGQPYLWFAASLAGNGSFDHGGRLSGNITGGGAYCSLLRENESIVSFAPGVHAAAGLAITRERLSKLLEGQSIEGPVGAFLRGRFDPTVAQFSSTPETRAILRQMFSHPYKGAIETIYLEAKAYELLAESLRLWTEQGGTDSVSRARRRALEAREFMMANLASPPSMLEVARHVGLSQRALANVFHEVYGASPLKCFNTWRLEAAQGLLHSGDYSVKQVAHLMGFAHSSNFSQAFTREYGRPPTDFQRA